MVLISVAGVLSTPLLMLIEALQTHFDKPEIIFTLSDIYSDSVLYIMLLVNIMIYVAIAAYLFSREYTESTLKTILPIPISRTKLLIGKYLMFFIWAFIITTITFTGTVIAAYLGGISDITLSVGLNSYKEMLISEILLCLSFSPFVVLSLVMPNMVFSMVAGAIFSIINLFVYTSKYAPYIPWCSPYLISSNEIANYSCNTATSLAILLATFAIGLTISYIYFTKKDVCL